MTSKSSIIFLISGLATAAVGCERLTLEVVEERTTAARDAAARVGQSSSFWSGVATHYASFVRGALEDTERQEPQTALAHRAEVIDSDRLLLDQTLGPATARSGVDAVRFRDRVYLGVRSLTGGALPSVRIDIVSSSDERNWNRETAFASRAEVHAPRFLVLGGKLMAYVSELDADGPRLEPERVSAAELPGSGLWSEFQPLALDGHVVWRTKVEHGLALMTTYSLGEKTYEFDEAPLEVNLLTTHDGRTWKPLEHGRRTVYRGAGSEAAISSDDDGNLFSVVRKEAGDEAGFGSAICAAAPSDWSRWDCVNDPRKYDSPTLFNHDGELYLVARRHLEDGGHETESAFTLLRRAESKARDLAAPKRCALWHFNRAQKRVEFILDLPSRGNTCSAAVIAGKTPGDYVIYDHSSDVTGPDLSLRDGLAGPTYIYRHVVRLK